ncbi:MAG: sigma-54-dependent Fis family transcriptional regulator [Deltaproteobacteria bacterium]|nr:sigma-54-dependent Fis family transcriptional regulator [Deltaproteobacteria bacterium]
MNESANILVITDEPEFHRLSSRRLMEKGHIVWAAGSRDEALQKFKEKRFDLVLLDLVLPPSFEPSEGLALIGDLLSSPVIVLTSHGLELAIRAAALGAWDFLTKPVDPDMLELAVARALIKKRLEEECRILRIEAAAFHSGDLGIAGTSKATRELRDLIRRIAPSDINVMVLGPGGTGKGLVARAIHRLSPRSAKPFMPVHCGAIPSELLESELFGHLKGSFTGADRDKAGLLESANGGVIFLDEIGEMPQQAQARLLRFMREGTYTPVGGSVEKRSDVRIISATERDLEKLVRENSFREELYYRLKGIVIRTLQLKDHIEDIPVLAGKLLVKLGNGGTSRLSSEVLLWLIKQPWNGNVRELENLLESALALSSGKEITLPDLRIAMHGTLNEGTVNEETLDAQLGALEKRLIIAALEEKNHNRSQTAKRLAISRAGLLKKMKRLGI